MYEPLNAQLPASWLVTRVGVDGDELERLRRGNQVFGTRPEGADEYYYSAWQFAPGGSVPEPVRRVVRIAIDKGIGEAHVLQLLRRRVGLTGGGRMLDLLFEGDGRRVISELHAAA
jgi:hypothetical protein